MIREFVRDDEWQKQIAGKFLDPFYRLRGWIVERFPGDHSMQRLHVDVSLRRTKDGKPEHSIDEKIIRGLRKGGPAEKINLETWSCSVPGKEKRGWIDLDEPSKATVLFVCHADVSDLSAESWRKVTCLDCVWIPFQPLRIWFWKQGEERWERNDNHQPNRSISRKVPITEIMANVANAKRFTIYPPEVSTIDTLSPAVRTCHQCNKPHDGTEREILVGSFLRWLHPGCESAFMERVRR